MAIKYGVNVMMRNTRAFKRLNVTEEMQALYKGHRCRVLDVSHGGMSVVYARFDPWPDLMIVDLVFPRRELVLDGIECMTVWENGFDSGGFEYKGLLKRRGFRFIEPDSGQLSVLTGIMGLKV